jgi:hypothetical protein
MKKNFYVCDSYFTNIIAESIKTAFPESNVFTDSTVVSIAKDSLGLTLSNVALKMRIESDIKKDSVDQKIDFFILSGKLIHDGSVSTKELRSQYGSEKSIFIAVSLTPGFWDDNIKNDVDFSVHKNLVMNPADAKKLFAKWE